MLRFKKSIFILFAAIIVFSLSCCANNNSKSSPALWADGDPMVASTDQNSLDAVKWFSSKDKGKEITKTAVVGSCIFMFILNAFFCNYWALGRNALPTFLSIILTP